MSLPNPLLPLHEQADAELQPYDQTTIVTTFGQPEAEYAAIRKSAGLMDLPQRGIIEVTGPDRLPFLNNLLTNQLDTLKAGQGSYSFILNGKGRIEADVNVLELAERTLLELDVALAPAIAQMLEKYHFAERVRIESTVGQLHELVLHGPGSLDLLRQFSGQAIPDLPALGSAELTLLGQPAILWRDDQTGSPGFFLLIPTESAPAVWTALLDRFFGPSSSRELAAGRIDPDRLGERPLRPIGWAAFNAARIEAGRPIFRIDFDSSVLPAETGLLERAVSFTKGCYLGQEIVARMHSRGQLARRLVGLRMEEDALPIAGAHLYDEQSNEVGGITSSTVAPLLSGASIALGYLKRGFFEEGSTVRVPAEGQLRTARVVPLPFVRP